MSKKNTQPTFMEGCLGEIRLWAGSRIPEYWATCRGQLLTIDQYTALYQVLGTTYGGDGITTFALPDLQGRVAMGCDLETPARGKGKAYAQPRQGGNKSIRLTASNLPPHQHTITNDFAVSVDMEGTVKPLAANTAGTATSPAGNFPAQLAAGGDDWATAAEATASMGSTEHSATSGAISLTGEVACASTGKGEAFANRQQSVALHFIICLVGSLQSNTNGMVGEVRMFAQNALPKGWTRCTGDKIGGGDAMALTAIAGLAYDRRFEVALPDLRNRIPMHAAGSANGVQPGQLLGHNALTITTAQLPQHAHALSSSIKPASTLHFYYAPKCAAGAGDTDSPDGAYPAAKETSTNAYTSSAQALATMAALPVAFSGTPTVAGQLTCQQVAVKPQPVALQKPYHTIRYGFCMLGSTSKVRGYLGEIRMISGNRIPAGWALCNGALLPLSGNISLFQLLGTAFGGDGRKTFALPNLGGNSGRAVVGVGVGPDGPRKLGQVIGSNTHQLAENEMPPHAHEIDNQLSVDSSGIKATVTPKCASSDGDIDEPGDNYYAQREHDAGDDWATADEATATMGGSTITLTKNDLSLTGSPSMQQAGGGRPIDMRMAGYGLYYIICIDGRSMRWRNAGPLT